jgi:hypothetical protein
MSCHLAPMGHCMTHMGLAQHGSHMGAMWCLLGAVWNAWEAHGATREPPAPLPLDLIVRAPFGSIVAREHQCARGSYVLLY